MMDPGVMATIGTAIIALDLAAVGAAVANARAASRAETEASMAREAAEGARDATRDLRGRVASVEATQESRAAADGGEVKARD